MDIWKPVPASESEVSFCKPSLDSEIWKPAASESQVSFWKPSSSESEGSIWIPSSESEGCFWKPSSEFSSFKSSGSECRFWRWKPSSESEGSFWKPSSSESEVQRRFRRDVAKEFRKEYKFEHGKKTRIWSNGIYSRPDECYDLVWVAVHGMDSICIVTRSNDVDMTRLGSYYQRYYTNEQTLCSLVEALVSEIECLPYDDERLCENSGKGIEKPFGVVSVIPGTKKVHEESGHEDSSAEYDEEKAINFLKERMMSGSAFTLKKTIRRAISAFQLLCRQEFLAEDIWVTVLDGKGPVEHLGLSQKMRHLAVIGGYSFLSRSGVFRAHHPISWNFQV